MFNTMNPFHPADVQHAVGRARARRQRVLHRVLHDGRGHLAILARRSEGVLADWARMPRDERKRREKRYRVAADLAVLQMPEQVRTRVAPDWDDALARSLANGTAETSEERPHQSPSAERRQSVVERLGPAIRAW